MSESEEEVQVIPMPKYRIKFTDMPDDKQEKCIRLCDEANKKHKLDKEVCSEIQKMIHAEPLLHDPQAGWHVIVGQHFASSITYKTKCVIFFELFHEIPKSFLIFKTE